MLSTIDTRSFTPFSAGAVAGNMIAPKAAPATITVKPGNTIATCYRVPPLTPAGVRFRANIRSSRGVHLYGMMLEKGQTLNVEVRDSWDHKPGGAGLRANINYYGPLGVIRGYHLHQNSGRTVNSSFRADPSGGLHYIGISAAGNTTYNIKTGGNTFDVKHNGTGEYILTLSLVYEALNLAKLRALLILNEGSRNKVYIDTQNHPTIGVGFNLDRPGAKQTIEALGIDYEKLKAGQILLTNAQINTLLEQDMQNAIQDTKSVITNYEVLSDVRKRVLIDMMFNLGKSKFLGFQKMIAAVKQLDFTKAAAEMKDSAWYTQVGVRGPRLVKMMETNQDP